MKISFLFLLIKENTYAIVDGTPYYNYNIYNTISIGFGFKGSRL